jgi:hypothetical protein
MLGSNSRGLLDPEHGEKCKGGLGKDGGQGTRRCQQLNEQ